MSFQCEVCKREPSADRANLFRVNPIGEVPARWRCYRCLTPEQRKRIDPEILKITKIIQEGK